MAEQIIKYNTKKYDNKSSNSYLNYSSTSSSGTSEIIQDEQHWIPSQGTYSLIPRQSFNTAQGESSVAIGTWTETTNEGELGIGTFNVSRSGDTLFTIGDGTSTGARHNVFEVGSTNTIINNALSGSNATFQSVSASTVSGNSSNFNNGTFYGINSTNGTITNLLSDIITTDEINVLVGTIDDLESENITVDNLTVTKAAHFFKLIIDEVKATQGQVIITPSNAVIDKVETINGRYRCYFKATDGDKEIFNTFEANDQILCQTFNAATGTSYNASNTYYWRLCLATGTTSTTIDGQTVVAHYVDLSDSDKDSSTISTPKAGDNIVQLGNRTNTSRQAAIIISAYQNAYLDTTIEAPSIVQYYGINNYNLSTHRKNVISKNYNRFTGDFTSTAGNDLVANINSINGKINIKNYFSFNRGIRPASTTSMLYPYEYGFIGWGNLDRIMNFGLTQDDDEEDWTLTFQIKASSTVTVYLDFCDVAPDTLYRNGIEQASSNSLTATTSWVSYTINWEGLTSQYLYDAVYNGFIDFAKSNTATTIYLRNICLTKGIYSKLTFTKGEEDTNYSGSLQPFAWTYNNMVTNGTYRGLPVYQNVVHPSSNNPSFDLITHSNFTIKDLTPYTLSFWAKSDLPNTAIESYFHNYGYWNLHASVNGTTNNGEDGYWKTDLTTSWKHYTIHWYPHVYSTTGTSGYELIKHIIPFRLSRTAASNNSAATVSICGVNFCEGWTEDEASTTNSLIQQTQDEIELSVYDTMLNRTGIDIQNGLITIDADNTNFNGNIKLFNPSEGITLFQNMMPTVRIKNEQIGNYDSINFNSTVVFNGEMWTRGASRSQSGVAYLYNYLTSSERSLGTLAAGTTVAFSQITVNLARTQALTWKYVISMSGQDSVVSGYTTSSASSNVITLPSSTWNFTTLTRSVKYTIYLEPYNSSTYPTQPNWWNDSLGVNEAGATYTFSVSNTVSNLTTIANGGMYSAPATNKLFWVSDNNIGAYWYNSSGYTDIATDGTVSRPYIGLRVNDRGISDGRGSSMSNIQDYPLGSIKRILQINNTDGGVYPNANGRCKWTQVTGHQDYYCFADNYNGNVNIHPDHIIVRGYNSSGDKPHYIVIDEASSSGELRSPIGRQIKITNATGYESIYVCVGNVTQFYGGTTIFNALMNCDTSQSLHNRMLIRRGCSWTFTKIDEYYWMLTEDNTNY